MISISDFSFSFFSIFTIRPYGLFLVVGLFFFHLFFKAFGQRKLNLTVSGQIDVICLAAVAATFGGRLFYLFEAENPVSCGDLFCGMSSGGLSILGAILSVPLVLFVYAQVKNIPFLRLMDVVCVNAPFLDMFGRIGCFFAGCCFGLPWNGFLAVSYDASISTELAGVSLFPIQLVFALCFGFLWDVLIIIYLKFKKAQEGLIFGLYLFFASLIRFILDFWRGDRLDVFIYGCTKYQLLSLGILVFSASFIVYLLCSSTKRLS
jgi:phosphatidylglycerol:prolipoprotein diacylglycerol transferase